LKRYEEEKASIAQEAKKLESIRDEAQKHTQPSGWQLSSCKLPYCCLR